MGISQPLRVEKRNDNYEEKGNSLTPQDFTELLDIFGYPDSNYYFWAERIYCSSTGLYP